MSKEFNAFLNFNPFPCHQFLRTIALNFEGKAFTEYPVWYNYIMLLVETQL